MPSGHQIVEYKFWKLRNIEQVQLIVVKRINNWNLEGYAYIK